MYKVFFLLFFPLFCALASMEPLEDDVNGPKSYKNQAIISGYSANDLINNGQGIMTLLFKKDSSPEHGALVFEYETYKNSKPCGQLDLRMVHYGHGDDCSGLTINMEPIIEGPRTALPKIRSGKRMLSNGTFEVLPEIYTKYASWKLSRGSVILAISLAEKDEKLKTDSWGWIGKPKNAARMSGVKNHCINYLAKIMREAGFEVNFWPLKPNTASHLRGLIEDGYVTPSPDKIEKDYVKSTL